MPSSTTMVSWWLNGGEGVDAPLPSWIAPRNISHEVFVRPSVAPAPHSVSSLAPPNERLIASLRPPSNPHIAIQEDLPGYPDLRDENDALRRQLAEMAISGGLGAQLLAAPESIVPHAYWFGEDQARYIVTVAAEQAGLVLAKMRGAGVPCARIGTTGGDAINIAGRGPVSVEALATAFESWFPAYMGSAWPSGQV